MTETWVVVAPDGLYWVGLACDEADAWRVALRWPLDDEVREAKLHGWYAAKAQITWRKP